MGNTLTSNKLPDKNYFYQVKEHFADDYTVVNSLDGVDLLKLKVDELFTSDEEELKKVGERLVKGLKEDNVVILQLNEETYKKVMDAFIEAKKFLAQSQKKKEEFAAEKIEEKRAFYSGYSLIHFDNRNNKRDEEWRDVYQIRYGEEGHIPWPSDSFKQHAQQLYEAEWAICVQALKAIGLALSIKPSDLLELAVGDNNEKVDVYDSANTNLCLFHYFDKLMSYKTPQKCMVHKDHGLLTLLPKTDVPGLELLHPQLKQWIPIENFIENTDVLLYCGEALQIVTDSKVEAAAHRVVRLPHKERYSMPFESKPNDNAVLRNLVNPEKDPNPTTFDGLTKQLQWQRVMKQVSRADGIEPTESGEELNTSEEPNENDIKPDFGQAHHDVQLPSITVK